LRELFIANQALEGMVCNMLVAKMIPKLDGTIVYSRAEITPVIYNFFMYVFDVRFEIMRENSKPTILAG
jgi:hypothetical protein